MMTAHLRRGLDTMSNIELGSKQNLTTYRKIAIASWRHPRDPSTYSSMDLIAEPAGRYLAAIESEDALTLTHYVTRIIGYCLKKYPELAENWKQDRGNPGITFVEL